MAPRAAAASPEKTQIQPTSAPIETAAGPPTAKPAATTASTAPTDAIAPGENSTPTAAPAPASASASASTAVVAATPEATVSTVHTNTPSASPTQKQNAATEPIAGKIPIRKPLAVAQKFVAMAATQFGFKAVSAPARMDGVFSASAKLDPAPLISLQINASDSNCDLHKTNAWVETRDFHRATTSVGHVNYDVLFPVISLRTATLEPSTISFFPPAAAEPWRAEPQAFSASVAQLGNWLSLELPCLDEPETGATSPDLNAVFERIEAPAASSIGLPSSGLDKSAEEATFTVTPEPVGTVSVSVSEIPRTVAPAVRLDLCCFVAEPAAIPVHNSMEPAPTVVMGSTPSPIEFETAVTAPTRLTIQIAENPVPNPSTLAASIDLPAVGPDKKRPVQVYTSALVPAAAISVPVFDMLPLRPVMFVRTVKNALPVAVQEQNTAVIEPVAPAQPIPSEDPSLEVRAISARPVREDRKYNLDSPIAAPRPSGKKYEAVAAPIPAATPSVSPRRPAPAGSSLGLNRLDEAKVTLPQPSLQTRLKSSELDLPQLDYTPPAKNSNLLKIAGAVGAVLVVAAGLFFAMHGNSAKPEAPAITTAAPGPEKDWVLNFSPDSKNPRSISLLRSSQDLRDYRVEFSGLADVGALGWVFRAKDAKNFYVTRLEKKKPVSGTSIFVVHYAVIDGTPQARVEKPVVGAPPADGIYQVRLEVAGNHFTTWVQGTKVDDWMDARLASGGTGFYSESGEHAMLRSPFQVTPLGKGNQ
jgi:hypothetical protein